MKQETPQENTARWNMIAQKALGGLVITKAEYQTDAEAEEFGWYERGLKLTLEDQHTNIEIVISQDDEGNGPGAIFTTVRGAETLPTLRFEG